jgi:hypothetical protein
MRNAKVEPVLSAREPGSLGSLRFGLAVDMVRPQVKTDG